MAGKRKTVPIGTVFGWLTTISGCFTQGSIETKVRVRCKCGTEKTFALSYLKYGQARSCGCYRRSKEACSIKATFDDACSIRDIYKDYEKKAENREINFNLSLLEFESFLFKNCYYCDLAPSNTHTHKSKYIKREMKYNGIDRLDNNRGYELDNCVTCCKICNRTKSSFKADDFKIWLNNLAVNYLKNNKQLNYNKFCKPNDPLTNVENPSSDDVIPYHA